MFCRNCGNELKEGAKFCDNCGTPVDDNKSIDKSNNSGLICPNCGGHNISVQRESNGNVATSRTKYYATKKHHGILYWICIGWWIWLFKVIFIPLTMIFGHSSKKNVGRSKTVTGTKSINHTVAVCQSCGHSWNV